MYEGNNGSPEWRAKQLIGEAREVSVEDKNRVCGILMACGIVLTAAFITELGINCFSDLAGPSLTCGNGVFGVNYHQHVPTGTHSLAFCSEAGSLIDRAGAAWIPGDGLKIWLNASFTDGLKEYYLKLPKFP